MKHKCPCDCYCVSCSCVKDDDYFYIFCTNCMFKLLPQMRVLMNHWPTKKQADLLKILREVFDCDRSFAGHWHKTLIVLPIHFLPDNTFPFEPQISGDIPIRKMESFIGKQAFEKWQFAKSSLKKGPVIAYTVLPNGKSAKIKG